MNVREALEARLQARWNLEDLVVYADALITEGDVRGELIALDLHSEPRPLPIKRNRQRLALLARWLGDKVAARAYDLTRCGFIDTRPDAGATLLPVLDRVGPYVRAIDFLGSCHDEIRALVEKLASEPRPWLTRLAITLDGDTTLDGPIIHGDLAVRLIAATPRLTDLELEACDLFVAFPHPAVVRLRSSHRGILTLSGDNEVTMPSVTELDLALSERFDYRELKHKDALRLLPPAALPTLTNLDLSRNEFGLLQPFHRRFDSDLFRMLSRWPICAQLTHLRVPALHDKADLANLTGLVARMPALVELEIARGYPDMEQLLPRLAKLPRVRAPRWLWPWPLGFALFDSLVFEGYGLTIKTQGLACLLEFHYDAMPEAARDAWSRLWALVRSMRMPATRLFPRADFEVAMRALPEVQDSQWSEFYKRLANRRTRAARSNTVKITRFAR